MKIIISTFTFAPAADGVARAAGQMADIFAAAGHEVEVLTGEVDFSGVEVGAPYAIRRFSGEAEARDREFLDHFRAAAADVAFIHCWDSWSSKLLLRNLKRLPGKIVLVSHGFDAHILFLQRRFPWGLVWWARRLRNVIELPFLMRRLDHMVFLSERRDFGRFFDRWVASLAGATNVSTIPNSCSVDGNRATESNFREANGLGSGPIFLCVANYTARKNQELALYSFLQADVSGSSLVFIGSEFGTYGERVRTQWEAEKTAHRGVQVLFLERQPRELVESALDCCDAFLLAARAETQPIVLLEAMAMGKPFVSTDVGCVREFDGGLVVRDRDELTGAIRRLATDPDERARLGARGKAYWLANHSEDRVAGQWLALLGQLSASAE